MRLPIRKHHNFLPHLLKPPPPTTTLRHYSADPDTNPNSPALPPTSPVNQIVSLLQTTPTNDWPTTTNLHHLLTSLSPNSLLKITRQLPSSEKSLQFFNYLKTHQPFTPSHHPSSLSFTFQAVLEHTMREHCNDPTRLYELFTSSKSENIPLSINSATLLLRCFGRARMYEESLDVYRYLDPDSVNTHVVNLLLDSLLRAGRVDDGFKVLDEMFDQEANFSPNDTTMDIVLANVLGRHWSGRTVGEDEIVKVISRFSELGVFPNSLWLTQLLTKFCRGGKCDMAWELLHEVIRVGGKVEASACNALLTGLGKERDFVKMNLLMKEMKENGIEPNVVTFGILINHLCKFRRVDDALEVFKNMKGGEESDGVFVEPDVVIYNTLIDGLCKVGREEEAMELMDRMRLQPRCSPNTITYNCVIDGLCKAGMIEKARELFDKMREEGIQPNVITLNTMLDGMCRSGRVSTGMEFFNEMQGKGVKANAVTYTILITSFCNANNINKAMKLFDEMIENGCSPDAIVYYSLICGLSQAGKMDDASLVASKLREAGFCLDIISYNIMISGFCRRNKLDKAYEMLKDMESAGVNPDRVTYNTVISHFSDKGDFTTAHRVMKKMTSDGYVPNVVTYGALIHAYCQAGNLDEAMKIFRDMKSTSKVLPNTVIYNSLINSFCKNDKIDDALSLWNDMKGKGVKPNTTTFNALLKGLEARQWLEKALELMDEMIEQACDPDYITMEILTEWFSAVGETEKLRKFVQGYEVSNSTAQSIA